MCIWFLLKELLIPYNKGNVFSSSSNVEIERNGRVLKENGISKTLLHKTARTMYFTLPSNNHFSFLFLSLDKGEKIKQGRRTDRARQGLKDEGKDLSNY
jgi:hypothetical protein